MDTKLTLKLDKNIIEKAKIYAKNKNISLSRMIESYLKAITNDELMDNEVSPLVQSFIGIITIPDDFNYKEKYTDHLLDKY
ncbi:DUF6364 family protein [Bacteroidota bacterium]